MNTDKSVESKELLKPPPLRSGDRIAVISPAGSAEKNRLQRGVDELKKMGYQVEIFSHAAGRYSIFSARDEERREDLIAAFRDPEIRAILCSRGGYGSNRLLDGIPFEVLAANPKIFVGFSDLTALTWSIFKHAHLVTFTGPLVCEFGENLPELTLRSFNGLIGAKYSTRFLWDGVMKPVRAGSAAGPLYPGCLSIIVTLLGTPHMPDLSGAVLLIEDTDEKPYQIDRMLYHLKNAGVFRRISALLVGRFTNCWPKIKRPGQLLLEEMLLDVTADHPIPIYIGLPYGHHPERVSLPVGVEVEISKRGRLRLLEDPLLRKQ
jgi:muramoyltetrapeptide carboxypeptidase